MKKLLLLLGAVLVLGPKFAFADENAYFKVGPLELNIPFKVGRATYMYDFKAHQNLVGAESPFATVWGKVEGTFGAVTSLEGQGTPFVGGNILVGNLLDKWVTLPDDFAVGGFGGWNFHTSEPMYGLKASIRVW